MTDTHTPTRQLPARELIKRNIGIPFWHEDDDKPVTYHLQLLLLEPDALVKLAIICRKRAAEHFPNPLDNRINLDYEPTPRELVNTLRHTCLNRTPKNVHQFSGFHCSYNNLIARITAKGIDVEQRCLDLKLHALTLIATYYPYLAAECKHQAFVATTATLNRKGTSQ